MIRLSSLNRNDVLRRIYNTDILQMPKEEINLLIKTCEKELLTVAKPRYIYKRIETDLPMLSFISADISTLTSNSDIVVIYVATLSFETDLLINKYSVTAPLKSVMLNALADVALEQLCEKIYVLIESELENYELTRTYSPFYGDLPMSTVDDFLLILKAEKKAGIYLNHAGELIPKKTNTGIIGSKPKDLHFKDCSQCIINDTCSYLKRSEHCGYSE